MKMLMKIGLFFLTLFLGIQAVRLANCLVANMSVPADADIVVDGSDGESTKVERPGGIRILYDGRGAIIKPQFFFFLSTTVRSANCLVSDTVDGAYRRKYGSVG